MSAVAYRNAELYRHEGKYQFGVFPLAYRNSYAYQSKVSYRSGVDDPIFDTFTVAESATLVVNVTATDTINVAESTPGIGVESLAAQGTTDSQQFLEATIGTVGLNQTEAISGTETLNTQGTSLNSTDSITGTEGTAGLSFELQTDSGSSSDNWVSTTVTMTLTDAASALESLGAVAVAASDTGVGFEGPSPSYRNSNTYQTNLVYRRLRGATLTLAPVDAENLSALEALDYAGGGNNRTTVQSEEILVTFNITGPFGEVAQHLSHIAVNRYRSTPSAVRRR